MNEKRFRRRVLELLKPICAMPVENSMRDGMPDIVTVAGWIELKVAHHSNRIVNIDLRNSQRIWLRKWRKHGGRAWTLTLLGDGWILHDGLWSADNLGLVSEEELIKMATDYWLVEPHFKSLIDSLLRKL